MRTVYIKGLLTGCVCGLLATSPALAQTGPVGLEAVISALTLDLNGDGSMDRAVLIDNDGEADLRLYVARDDNKGVRRHVLALEKKAISTAGGMAGTIPYLAMNARGSLQIKSQNSAIGRNRWEQTLTVVYRDGKHMVAGVEYSYYDTLDLNSNGKCDLNLLTAKGTRNGKPVNGLKAVMLQDWNDELISRWCSF